MTVRLNSTLKELKEKAAAKCGVTLESRGTSVDKLPGEFAICHCRGWTLESVEHEVHIKSLELHFSGYQLQPETNTIRQFTELCQVTQVTCSQCSLRN